MSSQIKNQDTEVRTYFVRGRNALVARANFSKIYIDYYLHIADCGFTITSQTAEYAKNALAAIALHCASHPRNERAAWTVHFQTPLLNVFAAGDSPQGTLITNIFSENVRVDTRNIFYADTIRGNQSPRRSVVDFEGKDFFSAVECYYAHSEQRMARFIPYSDEDYVLISAQPDCDLEWLVKLDTQMIQQLDKIEELSLLEQRHYRFECGCNQVLMMRVLLPTFRQNPEVLFEGEELIRMSCPRCGARHAITREALEALAKTDSISTSR